jgi:outer membrane protein assembly factor BamB
VYNSVNIELLDAKETAVKRIIAVFFLLSWNTLCCADDWPGWRGPTGQGYCFEKNLPMKWSPKENIKWKIPLAHGGNSTPIVWKDRIFLTMANKPGTVRSLLCFDRADGKQLWKKDVDYAEKERNWPGITYVNASAVTDGQRVIVSLASAGLFCFDLDGKELWKRTDLGNWQHDFGTGSSPILYGELCILYLGPDEANGPNGLLAVNKKSGTTVWQKDQKALWKKNPKAGSWGTPVVVEIDGNDQLLYCPGYKLESVDPKTGKDLWHCDGLMEFVYTSPLYTPKHKIAVAMSGFNKSALAVKVGGSGDITKDRLWHHPNNIQRVGSGIIVGDHVYILEENGTPHCYELATGKQVWQADSRPAEKNWGSMVHADGKLYVLTRDASTVVFNASPKYELLATNRLDSSESTNASPAISNGEIFLRTNQHLWCIREKK